MKQLCEKYPALVFPVESIKDFERLSSVGCALWFNERGTLWKEKLYKHYKANISCIGLTPEEYETCIQWFCEIMEY
jgi:hypothetical protein